MGLLLPLTAQESDRMSLIGRTTLSSKASAKTPSRRPNRGLGFSSLEYSVQLQNPTGISSRVLVLKMNAIGKSLNKGVPILDDHIRWRPIRKGKNHRSAEWSSIRGITVKKIELESGEPCKRSIVGSSISFLFPHSIDEVGIELEFGISKGRLSADDWQIRFTLKDDGQRVAANRQGSGNFETAKDSPRLSLESGVAARQFDFQITNLLDHQTIDGLAGIIQQGIGVDAILLLSSKKELLFAESYEIAPTKFLLGGFTIESGHSIILRVLTKSPRKALSIRLSKPKLVDSKYH